MIRLVQPDERPTPEPDLLYTPAPKTLRGWALSVCYPATREGYRPIASRVIWREALDAIQVALLEGEPLTIQYARADVQVADDVETLTLTFRTDRPIVEVTGA